GQWIVYAGEGVFALKECRMGEEHLKLLKDLTDHIAQTTGISVQQIVSTGDGTLTARDIDDTSYMLQTFCEGRECNIRDSREWGQAVRLLAGMHRGMQFDAYDRISLCSLDAEFHKRNRELRKIRRYLKEKKQKNEFERILYNQYGCFLEQALKVEEDWRPYEQIFAEERKMWFCHGDYQYHSVWFGADRTMILHLEKYMADVPCRDLYQFMRKFLEKNNWDKQLGEEMLEIYEQERTLPLEERISLIYRFSYPEKFWKIANHYYNNKKCFTPEKSGEKLLKVFSQERARQNFIEDCLKAVVW
ncbi:MAG: CotS family spore coat protein, partial [Lachnospiraceae bacterium]|nr:CotS family spore coat protein [Lachnospiraceae bacterium]